MCGRTLKHTHTRWSTHKRTVMTPVVSHHLVASLRMSISQVRLNRTPPRRILMLRISIRTNDLLISCDYPNCLLYISNLPKLIKNLIITFPTLVKRGRVQSLSWRLTRLWPEATLAADSWIGPWTWTRFRSPREWNSHAALYVHHYLQRLQRPLSFSVEKVSRGTAVCVINTTPRNVLHVATSCLGFFDNSNIICALCIDDNLQYNWSRQYLAKSL